MTLYVVRPGPFSPPVTWRVEAGFLSQSRVGRPDRRWTLAQARRVRLAPATNRYVADAVVLRLGFRRGGVTIGSHGFESLGHYADQSTAFRGFARALCREAAAASPHVRFDHGRDRAAGVFTGAMAILAVGLVMVVLTALAAKASALGFDLGARLAFALLIMIAIQPWLGGAGPQAFDPLAIPPEAFEA